MWFYTQNSSILIINVRVAVTTKHKIKNENSSGKMKIGETERIQELDDFNYFEKLLDIGQS